MVTNTAEKPMTETREKFFHGNLDEPIPFLEKLPYGYQKIAEYECTCDYDFYKTGEESRVNGCGGLYYRRISISPSGMMHNERTACKCVLEHQAAYPMQHLRAEIEHNKQLVAADVNRIFNSINLINDPIHKRMTLDNFNCESKSQKQALYFFKQYQLGSAGICLYGYAGRGKTHLAMGFAQRIHALGHSVLVLKIIDLLDRVKKSYEGRSVDTENDVINILRNVDLLVIDDIGIENETSWVKDKLYKIIDYRHDRKTTVFTTNLSGKDMSNKYAGDTLVSRIWGSGKKFEIQGGDYRLKEKYESWLDIGREVTQGERA